MTKSSLLLWDSTSNKFFKGKRVKLKCHSKNMGALNTTHCENDSVKRNFLPDSHSSVIQWLAFENERLFSLVSLDKKDFPWNCMEKNSEQNTMISVSY